MLISSQAIEDLLAGVKLIRCDFRNGRRGTGALGCHAASCVRLRRALVPSCRAPGTLRVFAT